MKKQVAKTISILSLFVVLSVGATSVSAFPCPGGGCGTPVQYAVSASVQTTSPADAQSAQDVSSAPTQDTTATYAQTAGDVSFVTLFWVELATFFTQLR